MYVCGFSCCQGPLRFIPHPRSPRLAKSSRVHRNLNDVSYGLIKLMRLHLYCSDRLAIERQAYHSSFSQSAYTDFGVQCIVPDAHGAAVDGQNTPEAFAASDAATYSPTADRAYDPITHPFGKRPTTRTPAGSSIAAWRRDGGESKIPLPDITDCGSSPGAWQAHQPRAGLCAHTAVRGRTQTDASPLSADADLASFTFQTSSNWTFHIHRLCICRHRALG